ncbi:MAG: KpsF/GutQ family sugar-phosphate isomerase [Candidatus Orphnella occulta]|nr:KpsF/GutQ family sugar-phosphate isomerase [Candidatus Orphnella occulta]MDP8297573.1 KpsF/GutQ family sugar-phosphate isomerase [Candidatus Orphnella occulta]
MSNIVKPVSGKTDFIKVARSVLQIEAKAVRSLMPRVAQDFVRIVELIMASAGRIIITGMGKPGIIGQKISATLSSTGTASLFLHPAEAIHGDLGRVKCDDIIIALSNSGETDEIVKLIPIIKKIGANLIGIVGNKNSTLAKNSDLILDVSVEKEACPLGLAPTASTTAMLAMGDALSITLLKAKGFRVEDFAFYHPGGTLGKKLWLKVEDVMRKGGAFTIAKQDTPLRRVLYAITKARAGSATIVDNKGRLVGIFTDGDLRRHLEKDSFIVEKQVKDLMTEGPAVVEKGKMAVEALHLMRKKNIDEIPVVDKNYKPVGLVDIQDLLKAGLI